MCLLKDDPLKNFLENITEKLKKSIKYQSFTKVEPNFNLSFYVNGLYIIC